MLKYIIAVLGFFTLGPFGALLGFFVGTSLDRFLNYGSGAVNPLTSHHRQRVFLDTLFSLMGKMSKIDGHISKIEITHAERLIAQLGVSAEHRQQAITQFRAGAEESFNVELILKQFLSVCGHTHTLKQALLGYLITTALADGVLHSAEENLLRETSLSLGFNRAAFEQLLNMVRAQSHFAGGQRPPAANALSDAYTALGVSASDSDHEIKKAYRRLMSQYHPDKLIGQGLPKDMVKAATEQSQEIQAAYELITKHREKN